MNPLQLSQLWIYPVKSLGGISMSSARVLPKGLEFDRRWMLVDDIGTAMTQREYPAMALFRLSIDPSQLTISYHSKLITVPIHSDHHTAIPANVWDDTVTVHEVSAHHSAWFSEILGVRCKLVHFPEDNPRPVDERYKINNDHVGLADAYPFLIIGQSSLDHLNEQLENPVLMNRFRPNFVFTGGTPNQEDDIREFTIGGNRFANVKPCARCVLITVDQDTAKKGAEPLRTLARYRQKENKVYFGQNVIALDYGVVSVGDEIKIGH
jgi:uncharacterized protein